MGRFLIFIFACLSLVVKAQYYIPDCHIQIVNNYSKIKQIPNSFLFTLYGDTFDFNCSNKILVEYKDTTCSSEFKYKGHSFKKKSVNGKVIEYHVYKNGVETNEFGTVNNGSGKVSYFEEHPVKLSKPKGYIYVFENGYLTERTSKETEKDFSEYKTEFDSIGNIVKMSKCFGTVKEKFSCINGITNGSIISEISFFESKPILGGIFWIKNKSKPYTKESISTYVEGWLIEKKYFVKDKIVEQQQYKLGEKHGLFIENGSQTYCLNGKRKGKNKPAGL